MHPRSPYSRIDALRSNSRVEVDGVVLVEVGSCVKLFETSLPTRFYLAPAAVDWTRLRHSDTVTRCSYKGTTSSPWSVDSDTAVDEDITWTYDFPTVHAHRIAGLSAFSNEHVDDFLLPKSANSERQ